MAKISIKILKNCTFSINFLKSFENFSGLRGAPAPDPYAATPITRPPLVDLDSPKYEWGEFVLQLSQSCPQRINSIKSRKIPM